MAYINGKEILFSATVNSGLDSSTVDVLNKRIDTVESIAKGANQAVAYSDYADMIENVENFDNDKFIVGQSILIETLDVPDLWVSGITEIPEQYAQDRSDDAVVNALKVNGTIKVGYYLLSPLETQKVDLTSYVKNTDYAGMNNQLGVVSLNSVFGITAFNNTAYKNALAISPANEDIIAKQTDVYRPITPARLSYAVKVGVTANTTSLTDAEKAAAQAWLGISGDKLYEHTISITFGYTDESGNISFGAGGYGDFSFRFLSRTATEITDVATAKSYLLSAYGKEGVYYELDDSEHGYPIVGFVWYGSTPDTISFKYRTGFTQADTEYVGVTIGELSNTSPAMPRNWFITDTVREI